MKLESEGDNSLCLFTSVERRSEDGGTAGEGCSPIGRDGSCFAQLPSIASYSTDADGHDRGCGAQSLSAAPTKQHSNGFYTETTHIISQSAPETLAFTSFSCEHFRFIDDEEDAENGDPPAGSVNHQNGDPNCENQKSVSNGQNEENRHLRENCQKQVEVSDCAVISQKQTLLQGPNKMGDANVPKSNGVVSKQIKGVLKKGKRSERKSKKNRVTFDESVTLYCDEFDEVQLLALRSAAEVNCPEVFYMFDPPIEYQDLLQPFEPPAEYRDIIENEIGRNGFSADLEISKTANVTDANNDVEQVPVIEETTAKQEDEEQNIDSCKEAPIDGSVVVAEDNRQNELQINDSKQQIKLDPTAESEKLFERFLEAEREFDEDEELNRVFHVLENDLANDEKNGTFDDNFFKKLINLLSAVEGDVPIPEGDLFTTTDFTVNEEDFGKDTEDDDQTHSRTLSEADSDCSVSSQDTIIVRLGEDENDASKPKLLRQSSETDTLIEESIEDTPLPEQPTNQESQVVEIFDEVFDESNNFINSEDLQAKVQCFKAPIPKSNVPNSSSSDLSRQSSGEQPPKDAIQDADDSTSSDSRSGEVEEDIKLDDIGYDEEDADDYDEECLRGMVRGNSKIRRIIKKNALQCTLFRGIEARRRQQPGSKYPRPKSPPLSQESLVEQLKWLTTVDDKEIDNFAGTKPPDVILSTGNISLNGSVPSSEDEFNPYHHPNHYPRHVMSQDGQTAHYHMQGNYPIQQNVRPSRPWMPSVNHAQVPQQFQRPVYPAPRAIVRPMPSQMPYATNEHMAAVSPVPRDYRDWRVIQRLMVNREDGNYAPPVDFKRCPNGPINIYRRVLPSQNHDELEQFVQQGSQRIERIRKRYSVAEEEEDPSFGFARRPSVRGVQNRIPTSGPQYILPELSAELGAKYISTYSSVDKSGQVSTGVIMRARNPPEMTWAPNPNWRPGEPNPVYCSATIGSNRPPAPIPVHRASVALTELSGCATLPHPKSHSDARYHSFAESMYSGSLTLPHKRWNNTIDPRTCMMPAGGAPVRQPAPHSRVQGPTVTPPTLQVPQHTPVGITNDERGVPEGASSSPKVSSDSLYHGPLQEGMPIGNTHDDGVIYYSMNV